MSTEVSEEPNNSNYEIKQSLLKDFDRLSTYKEKTTRIDGSDAVGLVQDIVKEISKIEEDQEKTQLQKSADLFVDLSNNFVVSDGGISLNPEVEEPTEAQSEAARQLSEIYTQDHDTFVKLMEEASIAKQKRIAVERHLLNTVGSPDMDHDDKTEVIRERIEELDKQEDRLSYLPSEMKGVGLNNYTQTISSLMKEILQ